MQLSEIDLNLLVSLNALLQEKSVNRAARRVGLSPSAMSHALSRLRHQLDDPILVRSGRLMMPTPRAEAIRGPVQRLCINLEKVFNPPQAFDPATLRRTFRIHSSDHITSVIGPRLDSVVTRTAPGVSLHFTAIGDDPIGPIRRGNADIAIHTFKTIQPDLHRRKLLEDHLACAVSLNSAFIDGRFTLARYANAGHITVEPSSESDQNIDKMLAGYGLRRRVARKVSSTLEALYLTCTSDYVLTVSASMAQEMVKSLPIALLPTPIPLDSYSSYSQIWHRRNEMDAAHSWLRHTIAGVAHTLPRLKQSGGLPPLPPQR